MTARKTLTATTGGLHRRHESVPPRQPHRQTASTGRTQVDRSAALFVSCPLGVEPFLEAEVRRNLAGLPCDTVARHGGVQVSLDQTVKPAANLFPPLLIEAALRLNLHSRLAQRVLWRVALGAYAQEDELYALARQVLWQDWIHVDQTLSVDVTSRQSPLRSLHFAGLRIKDAVCDQFRESSASRPSVDTRHAALRLYLHLDGEVAHLLVDTSGEPLFKRGWRQDKGEAPLKETLAAAMLAAAGWQGRPEDGPLLDPCCGSGTIAIEAAQMACGMAPGIARGFAFERLRPFAPHARLWQQLKQAARAAQHPPVVPIYAGDVSFRMTDFATRNAERAGVAHAIAFKTADALQRPAPATAGVLMFNPPYGERIAPKGTGQLRLASDVPATPHQGPTAREHFQEHDASQFFAHLSTHWKRHYTGWAAWVLSPDMKLPSAMRLKESRRVVLFNGPIECRLFRFDIVAGTMRNKPPAAEAGDATLADAD